MGPGGVIQDAGVHATGIQKLCVVAPSWGPNDTAICTMRRKDVLLPWASGPSSPGIRPEPDQGAPRSTAQYGDAVDVAPAMELPVLLLSPTAAGPW